MHVNLTKMLIVILALALVSSTISCTSHHKPYKPGGPMLSLHDAAIHYPSRIDERIDAGENVNNTNHMFGTPLMAAVRFGKTESVAALLARNANPNIPDKIGHLPLPFAARSGNAHGGNMQEIVKLLVKHGADINAKGYYGRTALHYAAIHGDLQQASFLLDNGADLNLRGDVFGFSPLFCAVSCQKAPMVEFLLARGASVSLTDDSDHTVMDIARNKNPKIVRLLEQYQPSQNSNEEPESSLLSPEDLVEAAYATYLARRNATRGGTPDPTNEYYPAYWADGIKALNPIKVYKHMNNIVVVQRFTDGTEQGKYICLPISSYTPMTGDDDFVFIPEPLSGNKYTLWNNGVFDFKRTTSK